MANLPENPIIYKNLPWLVRQIAVHSLWSLACFSSEWDIKVWLLWAVRNGLVHIWSAGDDMSTRPEPTGGLILRPVSLARLGQYGPERLATEIFWTDPGGPAAFVDFLWAPGQQAQLKKILRTLKITRLYWQQDNKKKIKSWPSS